MFKMSFLSCSHPLIYCNIKQHLKPRPVFVFLACTLKPQVILFNFVVCSLSNKFPIMLASVVDSSSFRRVFVEVYVGALPGVGRELEWNSGAPSYTIALPCSPAALDLNCFQEKWCLTWTWPMWLSIFCMLDRRLPSPVTTDVSGWAGGDWPPGSGSGLPGRLVFQDKGRSGFLCEISQFLNVGKPIHIF